MRPLCISLRSQWGFGIAVAFSPCLCGVIRHPGPRVPPPSAHSLCSYAANSGGLRDHILATPEAVDAELGLGRGYCEGVGQAGPGQESQSRVARRLGAELHGGDCHGTAGRFAMGTLMMSGATRGPTKGGPELCLVLRRTQRGSSQGPVSSAASGLAPPGLGS